MPMITVLAGNPKIELIGAKFKIDPQIKAFKAALQFIRTNKIHVSRAYLLFDHIGKFEDQFLDPNQHISQRQRKHLNLGYLHPHIREPYLKVLEEQGMQVEDIHIITEAQCRLAMLQRLRQYPELTHAPLFSRGIDPCSEGTCRGPIDSERIRVTCKGIAAEAYRRCARYGDQVRTFWEYNQERCQLHVIREAIKLAQRYLSVSAETNANILTPNGSVISVNNNSQILI